MSHALNRTLTRTETISAVLGAAAAAKVMMLLPIVIATWSDGLGFGDAGAGYLASLELAGMAIPAILAPLWIARAPCRTTLTGGLALVCLIDLASIPVHEFNALAALRFGSGLVVGVVVCTGNALMARARNPEQTYGWNLAIQFIVPAALLALLPILIADGDWYWVYLCMAIMAGFGALISLLLPAAQLEEKAQHPSLRSAYVMPKGRIYPLLLSVMVYYVVQSGMWGYLERIGSAEGFGIQSVANAVALSSIVGLPAALLAARAARTFGLFRPLMLGMILEILAILLLLGAGNYELYLIAVALFGAAWAFSVPLMFGLLVKQGVGARAEALFPAAQIIGIAIGPAAVAFSLGVPGLPGYGNAIAACVLIMIAAALMLLTLKRAGDKE